MRSTDKAISESTNQHIRDYLTYYCQLDYPPEYAVLLKGLWGSGKTWFVKKFLEDLEKFNIHHLYISLYGISSCEGIENELIKRLYPGFSYKTARVSDVVTTNSCVEVGRSDGGFSDGSIVVTMPNEKLFNSFKLAEGKILVFDDIERCSIPVSQLLGYINKFVEHGEFKVIIIANEIELVEQNKKNKSSFNEYSKVKEKLVGKTFEVVNETESAIDYFITKLQCEKARKAIDENKPAVTQLYNCSGFHNLRILKHALLDFECIYSQFSDEITQNSRFVTRFLTLYLVFAFEIMSGSICSEEIAQFNLDLVFFPSRIRDDNNPYQKYIDIKEKYAGISFYDTIFKNSIWISLFDKGFLASDELVMAIRNSSDFKAENQPNWVKLWHGYFLSDDDFDELLTIVVSEWKKKTYKEIGVIKHVAGLLLGFAEIGLYAESAEEIVAFSREYLDHLKENGSLKDSMNAKGKSVDSDSWAGLTYHSKTTRGFKEITKYLAELEQEIIEDRLATEAKNLLQLMIDDTEKFMRQLILSNHEENRYYDVPILAYFDPSEFVKMFLKVPPGKCRFVAYVFKERYRFQESNAKLVCEIEFLQNIITLLNIEKQKRKGKMSGYTIGLIVDQYLEKAVANLHELEIDDEDDDAC